MKKYILLIFTTFIWLLNIYAQDSTTTPVHKTELFPKGLHFQPLLANQQEAHFGILYYTSNSNLKVDIGNSIDVLGFTFPKQKMRLTIGMDFFAYAYSTSFKGNRLQIDALDGLFGGNAVFSRTRESGRDVIRFRILHNSAHLVDGHFDQSVDKWIDDKKPIPYTRDFGELLYINEHIKNALLIKNYGGVAYSTLIRPLTQKKYSFIAGSEVAFINMFGKILDKETTPFFCYNFNLVGVPTYMGNNNIIVGAKFGDWNDKGIKLYLNYYAGQNYFSEYYLNRLYKTGIGFIVDF